MQRYVQQLWIHGFQIRWLSCKVNFMYAVDAYLFYYNHLALCNTCIFSLWMQLGMGNAKANAFWEAELRQSFKRPSENDHGGLESFIRSKYFFLSYCHKHKLRIPLFLYECLCFSIWLIDCELIARYEARRWVLQSNKSPTKAEEELHSTTNKPRRRLDNGREKKIVNTEKVDMKNHDDSSEFPEPRRHDSGTRTSTQSVSSFTFSDTSVSKVYSFCVQIFYQFMRFQLATLYTSPYFNALFSKG